MNRIERLKDAIKRQLTVREVVAAELSGIIGKQRRGYDTYPCPFHGERRGQALVVYDTYWKCFGKCALAGDAIAFIRYRHNLDFADALTYLNSRYLKQAAARALPEAAHEQRQHRLVHSEPPSAAWQRGAWRVIERCESCLWDVHIGAPALAYLRERGLTDDTIKHARLGYLPGHWSQWEVLLPDWGRQRKARFKPYAVPCGIVIPWIANGAVWGVKVRRAAGDVKYVQVADGNLSGALYLADDILPGQSLVITEGEFDALIIRQIGEDFFSAAALGSASHTNISVRWYPTLASTKRIYCLMDADAAGSNAGEKLVQMTAAAHILQIPDPYKDINEMYIADRVAAENFLIDHIW